MLTDLAQLQNFLEDAIPQLVTKLRDLERWRRPYVDGEIEAWNHLYTMVTGRRLVVPGVCPNCKEFGYIFPPAGEEKARCGCGRYVTAQEWEHGDQ